MAQIISSADTYEQRVRQILHRLNPDDATVQRLATLIRGFDTRVHHYTLAGSAGLTMVVAVVMTVASHDIRSDLVAGLVTLALAVLAFAKPYLKTVGDAALQKEWGGKPLPAPYIKALQDLANGERALQEQWITLWGALMVFSALLLKWIGGSTPA